MKSSEGWQINHSFARRSVLVFSLAMIILLIPSIKYGTQSNSDTTIPLTLGLSIILFITLKTCYAKFLSKKILIELGNIVIPRLFFRDYRIDCREVTAVESCNVKSSCRTVLIIRRGKIPVAISENLFICNEDFEEFIGQIKKNILSEYKSEKEIVFVEPLATNILSVGIAIVLIIVFLLFSQDYSELSDAALQIGGLTKNSFNPHEFYRLFSSFFLHYSVPHLALNLMALGIFSRPVEIIVGRSRVFNTIFISALTGSIFSVLLSPFDVVAGASGGIFGLVGAYTVIFFKYNDKLVGSVFIPKNVLFLTIAIQIISDALVDDTDYFSHFFGFIAGMIYAGFICHFQNQDSTAKCHPVEKLCTIALCITYILALSYILIKYSN